MLVEPNKVQTGDTQVVYAVTTVVKEASESSKRARFIMKRLFQIICIKLIFLWY